MSENIKPMIVSVKEAMTMLSIGRTKLQELMNSGELKVVRIGSRTLIRVSDIEKYIERNTEGAQ